MHARVRHQLAEPVRRHVHAVDLPVGGLEDAPREVVADEAVDAEDEDLLHGWGSLRCAASSAAREAGSTGVDPERSWWTSISAAVAADRDDAAVRDMQARREAGRGRAALGGQPARARDHQPRAGDLGERARVGRRDGADQVVDPRRGLGPVDAAVLGLAAAAVAALREVVRAARRVAGERSPAGCARARSRRRRRPCRTPARAVSSGRIGTACWSTIAPASGWATISCSVAPVSVSPCSTAQFVGARPRYFGSSEPCRL